MAISEKVGASKFYNHLVEEFDRRLTQTAANVASVVLTNYVFQAGVPSSYDTNKIFPYTAPIYINREPSLTRRH